MAQKGIREFDAKRMLTAGVSSHAGSTSACEARLALVSPESDLDAFPVAFPWLTETNLAVKPDQLFGKRGKNNLLLLDANWQDTKKWIEKRRNQKQTIVQNGNSIAGVLTHFLVEPFTPHTEEYYLAITTEREGDVIHFSPKGGVDIEELWDTVQEFRVPILGDVDDLNLEDELPIENLNDKNLISAFMKNLYKFFVDYHFTYLELNPFTLKDHQVVPLDCVARVDDAAVFQCMDKWGSLDFPMAFGTSRSVEEEHIKTIDAETGASLKFNILNPAGRIWLMVAGGGASVIYADTVVDLGYTEELANYGEYSGNPSTEETYEYTRTILQLMTRQKDQQGRNKYLIIGGGIANFTDVAATFTGIIKAIEEYGDALKRVNTKIFVRRGGPNYKTGLDLMKRLGERIGIPMEVYGPEMHMTRVVKLALEGE